MDMMLYNKKTGEFLGQITEDELGFLEEYFEDSAPNATSYYVDAKVIDALEELGATNSLLALLRLAIGGSKGMDITWKHE